MTYDNLTKAVNSARDQLHSVAKSLHNMADAHATLGNMDMCMIMNKMGNALIDTSEELNDALSEDLQGAVSQAWSNAAGALSETLKADTNDYLESE